MVRAYFEDETALYDSSHLAHPKLPLVIPEYNHSDVFC